MNVVDTNIIRVLGTNEMGGSMQGEMRNGYVLSFRSPEGKFTQKVGG
jgi:hypothetical protein